MLRPLSLWAIALLWSAPVLAADFVAQSREAGARLRQTDERLATAWAEHEQLLARSAAADQARHSAEAMLVPLLPALLRLSRLPATAVLAAPTSPAEALRGYAVLRATARYSASQVAILATRQREAAAAALLLEGTLARLEQLSRIQHAEAAALDRALEQTRAERDAQRDQAELAAAAAARHAADEAGRSQTMRAAVAAVARPSPVATPGRFVTPVAGPAIRRWGEATEAGPATGITFRPPPGARVTAPCGGRVVFAGPFRSYGLLVILDCGGAVHVVLAGFDRLDAVAGMTVPAGESIGTMPAGPAPRATLYVEIRQRGQPIDPGPFLGPRL